jgi:hypothetical protein
MMDLGKEDKERTIELLDPDFETATVINIVLSIMFRKQNILDLQPKFHRRTLKFLDKYDLLHEQETVRGHIALRLALPFGDEIIDLPVMFDLACWLHDWPLSGAVLARGHDYLNDEDVGNSADEAFGNELGNGAIFDPAMMSFERHQALPAGVIWALSRASLSVSSSGDRAMADEFVRLMQLKGESQYIRLRPR